MAGVEYRLRVLPCAFLPAKRAFRDSLTDMGVQTFGARTLTFGRPMVCLSFILLYEKTGGEIWVKIVNIAVLVLCKAMRKWTFLKIFQRAMKNIAIYAHKKKSTNK